MSQLQIYKASAGSGKTFRLTVEYLKIILAAEWNYKHILAVTFTNKATAEMKERVVKELYSLSRGEKSPYLAVLKEETGLPEAELTMRSQRCLKRILHDYSRFSISTIDSFFQRVIKAFSRELGIHTAYRIDLDYEQIMYEAVDELLLSIDENDQLQQWLKQFAREKIREGRSWNLKEDILELGKQIDNETFKELSPALHHKLNDKDFIRSYRQELQQIIYSFENTLKQIGREGLRTIGEAGFSTADFKYGKSGPANTFNNLLKAELNIGTRLLRALDDISELYNIPDKKGIEPVAVKVYPLLKKAFNYYNDNLRGYNTAKLITAQLYTLGILVDLQEMIRKVTREKGVVLISESGSLLKQIISGSETPFVYEKTGIHYHHFMIDEFQDTSGLQWNNFKPLFGNALAENNLGLVVGDVKQAIYRWRSGDWTLLSSQLTSAFPANGSSEKTLQKNWRSSGRIIRFNNRIFQLAPELLQQHFNSELGEMSDGQIDFADEIRKIYSESIQEIGKAADKDSGYVRMRFVEKQTKDNNDEPVDQLQATLDELTDQIRLIQDTGAPARDIAILVRKKDEAELIAGHLLAEKSKNEGAYNFNVLSSESLYVKNAASVAFILSLLSLLIDADDKLSLASANFQYYSDIEPRLAEIGKKPVFKPLSACEQLGMDFDVSYSPGLSAQFESIAHEGNKFYSFVKSDDFLETLGSRNLQEAVFKICEIFCLFMLDDELAYLQAFIDQVTAFIRDKNADISSFLVWWKDKGNKKTINVPEELDAIRIQTVHKAKGLEYNYVLIPFCDWSVDVHSSKAPVLWCRPGSPPFNRLELVPVKYDTRKNGSGKNSNTMANSLFSQDYFTEKLNNYVDNLNLLYVAFTRARTALFTWSVFNKDLSTIGDLLYLSVQNDSRFSHNGYEHLTLNLTDDYNEDDKIFESGVLPPACTGPADKKDEGAIRLNNFCFSDFSNYLKLRKNHENFFETKIRKGSNVNRGKVIHEILAKIRTAADLEQSIRELVFRGVLTQPETGLIEEQLKTLLADPEVKSWFDGTYRIMNERNILTGETGLKRPDRIMTGDGRVIVVDYKSGEKELDKYKYQVRNYMQALKACGYGNVSGYIWYTRNNKRVEVEA